MCGLFLLSVAVQWNDPDPWLWMPIYGLAAALAGLGAAGRLPLAPNAAALVLYLALFAVWAPSLVGARREAFEHWHMLSPGDEEAREAGGLALCALWSAVQTLMARGRAPRVRSQPRDGDELPALIELGLRELDRFGLGLAAHEQRSRLGAGLAPHLDAKREAALGRRDLRLAT